MVEREGEKIIDEKNIGEGIQTRLRKKVVTPLSPEDLPIVTQKAARYHGNPVLTRGGAGAWDEQRVDNPWVIFQPNQTKKYKMWYSGRPEDHPLPSLISKIGYAESVDGLSWTKHPDNPIFKDTDVPGGYPYYYTGTPAVLSLVSRDTGEQVYYMLYEEMAINSEGEYMGSVIRGAKSSDGIDWTKLSLDAEFTNFIKNVRRETRCFWIDRQRRMHTVINRSANPTVDGHVGPFRHYISLKNDFTTWNFEEEITMEMEFLRRYEIKVDDLHLQPLGRFLIGFANPYDVEGHGPLEMYAGTTVKNLQRIGNSIYPAKEVQEETGSNYHETCLVRGYEEYGFCPKVYMFQGWNPDQGKVTKDIFMAYLMLGEKRTYPVLSMSTLAGGSSTSVGLGGDCTEIPLHGVDSLTLLVELTFDGAATADPGADIHLRASQDGVDYTTEDYTSFSIPLNAGATVRKSASIAPDPRFLKVKVENLTSYQITDLKVYATLG